MLRWLTLGSSAVLHAGTVGAVLLLGAWGLRPSAPQASLAFTAPAPVALDIRPDPSPDRPEFPTPSLPSPLAVEEVELELQREEAIDEEPPAPRIAPDRPAPRLDRPCRRAERVPAPSEAAAPPAPEVESEIAPVEIRNPAPFYPLAARRRRQEGFVLLDLLVRSDGSVADPQVVASSGSPLFVDEVLRTVAGWSYRPATLGGVPVERRQQVRFIFRLE